jgi:hypothetical protein
MTAASETMKPASNNRFMQPETRKGMGVLRPDSPNEGSSAGEIPIVTAEAVNKTDRLSAPVTAALRSFALMSTFPYSLPIGEGRVRP